MRTGEHGTSAELLSTEPHTRIDASCTVERGIGNGSEPPLPVHQRETIAEQIRKRAFVFGTSRNGSAVEDWLLAERGLVRAREPELIEKGGTYDVRIPVSGFDAGETRVTALPILLFRR
jgi:hypothetical protein